MSSSKTFSRRAFLGRAAKLTLGGSGLYASLGSMNLMRALAADNAGDYRALVCIFLAGGNDSFNMLVPRSDGEYATYLDSRRNMAIAQEDILPLEIPGSGNALYGVHPSMPEVQQLFNSGALAMVSNVGALLEPVNKSAVLAEQANLPGQLFSHNNQIAFWQKLQSDNSNPTGWAGRMADLLLANSGNALSMNVSLSGSNLWQTGGQTLPYSVTPEGAITLLNIDVNSTDPGEQLRTEAFQALLNHPGLYQAEFGKVQAGAMETAATVNEALDSQSDLATTFPDSDLGESLNMVARMIQARDDLGVNNQMFFIITGGWDTHSDQLNTHPALLANLSACLAAFNDATIELGIAEKVTAFTASDFGRTLTSNGDGTDHAWGSNQLVLGGSVAGQSIYGLFPDLALDAELDVGGGRLIPTTAVDQYGATLAQWYASFSPSELAEIFPNLGNFSSSNLEFML